MEGEELVVESRARGHRAVVIHASCSPNSASVHAELVVVRTRLSPSYRAVIFMLSNKKETDSEQEKSALNHAPVYGGI